MFLRCNPHLLLLFFWVPVQVSSLVIKMIGRDFGSIYGHGDGRSTLPPSLGLNVQDRIQGPGPSSYFPPYYYGLFPLVKAYDPPEYLGSNGICELMHLNHYSPNSPGIKPCLTEPLFGQMFIQHSRWRFDGQLPNRGHSERSRKYFSVELWQQSAPWDSTINTKDLTILIHAII